MSDGRLVFDTALDTSGFDKGSEKLKIAINALIGKTNSVGKNITDSFNDELKNMGARMTPTGYDKYLQEFQSRMTNLLTDLSKVKDSIDLSKTTTQIDSLVNKLKNAYGSIAYLQHEFEQLGEVSVVSEKMMQVDDNIAEARKKLNDLVQARDAAMAANPENADLISDQYSSKISDAEKELESFLTLQKNLRESDDGGRIFGAETQEYEQLNAALQIIIKAYNDVAAAGNNAYQSIHQAAAADQQAKEQAKAAREAAQAQRQAQQQALANARLQTQNARTAAVQQQAANQQQVAAARAAAIQMGAVSRQQTQQQITNARTAATQTTAIYRAAATQQVAAARAAAIQQQAAARASATQQTANARTQAIQAQTTAKMVQSALRTIGQSIGGIFGQMSHAISSAVGAIRQLGSGILGGISSTFGKLGRILGNATNAIRGFASAAKGKLASAFGNMKKEGKMAIPIADQVVKKILSIKNLLLSRIKRTIIGDWFKDMKNGIGELAKHSASFNRQMSSMQNSLKMMTANGTVSFGNFISAIQPMITTILNAISQAIVYLNAFFALLQGKSVMTVAKKQTAAFGASAGGAAKKVKELKNQVYGFDELNKRDKDNDDSGGGGGGGGGGDLFEDVAISSVVPPELLEYFRLIKEAIGMGEWEEVGSLIAEGMNYVLEKIDEAILGIYDKAIEWSRNIARALNGFVGTFDFPLLGKTIADGINLAFLVVNEFITTFDWGQLGVGVAQGLNSLVKYVDFNLIGATLGNLLNGALYFFHATLINFDFEYLGQRLAAGMNTFMNTVDWVMLGTTLADYVNGWTDLLSGFAESAEWAKWGDDIGNAVTAFFKGVEWEEAGNTLQAWVDGIAEILWSLTENDEMWNTISNGISGFLNELFDEKSMANVITSVGAFVGKIFLTLGNITKNAPWETIGRGVAKGLNNLFDVDKATELGTAWSDAIDGVINGVYEFVVNFEWKGAADAVSTFVNSIFDIDWSKLVFTTILGLGSLGYAISQALADITSKFPEYGKQIGDGVKRIFGKDENGESYIKWDEIGKNYGDAFRNIVQGLANFLAEVDWKQVGIDLATMFTKIDWIGIAKSMWALFKNALKAAFNLVEGIEDAIKGRTGEKVHFEYGIDGEDWNKSFWKMTELVDPESFSYLGKEGGASLFEGFRAGLVEGADISQKQAIQSAILIGQGFYSQIYDESPEAAGAGQLLLTSIYSSQTVEGLAKSFRNAGMMISNEFAQSLSTAGFENVQAAISLLGQGVDEATVAALDITHLNENLESYMQKSGMGIQEVAQFLISDSSTAIKEMADARMGEIYTTLDASQQELVNHLVDGAMTDKERIAQAAYYMYMGLGDAIAEASPILYGYANDLLDGLYNAETVEQVSQKFEAAGFQVTDSFASALQGQGKENISAALFLLGQGIDAETIQALDLSNIDHNLKTYMEESGKTITEVAGELAEDAGSAIGRIVPDAAHQALIEGTQVVKDGRDSVADAADLGDKKTELETSSKEAGAAVPGSTGSGMQENLNQVDKPVENLITAIEKPMEKLTPDQKRQAEEMMHAIDKMISENNPVVANTMQGAAEAVLEKAQEYLNEDKGKELVTKFTGGIMSKIIQTQPNVMRAMKMMVTAVHTTAAEILNQTTGQTMAQAYSDGIHEGVNSLADLPAIIKGFIDAIQANVETGKTNILATVSECLQGVKNAVTGAGIASTFSSVASQAVSAMASHINYSAGSKLGSDMSAGLKNGINSGSGGVGEAASKVSLQVESKVKEALKIGSPSKVMHELGVFAMQGLANGIEETGTDAVKLVGDTAKAMSEAASGTSIEMGIDATAGSLGSVVEQLGNVASIFQEIAAVFNTMGASAIPSVANGTFLPYRTRIEDGQTEESQTMAATMARATADQTEVIEDQRDLLREILTTMRQLRLTLDVDSVTNAVTARQRVVERNTGTVVI